jgi:hypothetical protein
VHHKKKRSETIQELLPESSTLFCFITTLLDDNSLTMDPILLACIVLLIVGAIVTLFDLVVMFLSREIMKYHAIIMSVLVLYSIFFVCLILVDTLMLIGLSVLSTKCLQFMMVVLPLVYPIIALSALMTVTTPPPKTPDRRWVMVMTTIVIVVSVLVVILAPPYTDYFFLRNVLSAVFFFVSFCLFGGAVWKVRQLKSIRPAMFNFAIACIGIFFVCWCVELANIPELTMVSVHVTLLGYACLTLLLLMKASATAAASSPSAKKMMWTDWPMIKKGEGNKSKPLATKSVALGPTTGSNV